LASLQLRKKKVRKNIGVDFDPSSPPPSKVCLCTYGKHTLPTWLPQFHHTSGCSSWCRKQIFSNYITDCDYSNDSGIFRVPI